MSGMSRYIDLHLGDCSAWQPAQRPTFVIANPPWGRRLDMDGSSGRYGPRGAHAGGEEDAGGWGADEAGPAASEAWPALAAFMRSECPGAAQSAAMPCSGRGR
jgi:23S rRNA G2445 N2-methylase RlmL